MLEEVAGHRCMCVALAKVLLLRPHFAGRALVGSERFEITHSNLDSHKPILDQDPGQRRWLAVWERGAFGNKHIPCGVQST